MEPNQIQAGGTGGLADISQTSDKDAQKQTISHAHGGNRPFSVEIERKWKSQEQGGSTPKSPLYYYDPETGDFERTSYKTYQDNRSHPEVDVKNRADIFDSLPKMPTTLQSEDSPALPENPKSITLRKDDLIKFVGFEMPFYEFTRPYTFHSGSVQTVGTGMKNRLVASSGARVCSMVAVIARKENAETGQPEFKVRVFHAHPQNQAISETLRKKLSEYRDQGFTLEAAMHGGDVNDSESRKAADEIRTVIKEFVVEPDDELTDKREGKNTMLGAIILENTAKFVNEVVIDMRSDGSDKAT